MPNDSSDFYGALEAFVDALTENVYSEYDDEKRIAGVSTFTHVRNGLSRDGTEIVHWYGKRAGSGAETVVEVARFTRPELARWLLAEGAPVRAKLGLPVPSRASILEHAIARLRRGERLRRGGADDPGSGRPTTEWIDEVFESDGRFVVESRTTMRLGTSAPEETQTRAEFSEEALRARIETDPALRALFGID